MEFLIKDIYLCVMCGNRVVDLLVDPDEETVWHIDFRVSGDIPLKDYWK